MVPDRWRRRKLSQCAGRITSGATPKVGSRDFYGGDIPFLKIDDLTSNSGHYVTSSKTTITQKAIEETAVKIYPQDTVLVTMYGTIGAVGITAAPMAANQAIAAFLELDGVTPAFLASLLSHEAPTLASKAGRTTQSNISGRILKEHEVLLPPLNEQHKIVAILSSVDTAIERSQAVIDQMRVLKTGLMQDLLTCGVRRPSRGASPNWRWEPLGNLVTLIRNGTTATQNQNGVGWPVARIETIANGTIDYSKVRHLDTGPRAVEAYQLRTGDILMSHINSIQHIGKVARYDGRHPLIHGMNLMRIAFDERRVDNLFGYYALSSNRAKRYFERRAKRAINQASLNRSDIGDYVVGVPPLSEQHEIAHVLHSVDDGIETNRAALRQVQSVKSGLMSALLTGELRVTPDPKSE